MKLMVRGDGDSGDARGTTIAGRDIYSLMLIQRAVPHAAVISRLCIF